MKWRMMSGNLRRFEGLNLRWESRPDNDQSEDCWTNTSYRHFLRSYVADTCNDCIWWCTDLEKKFRLEIVEILENPCDSPACGKQSNSSKQPGTSATLDVFQWPKPFQPKLAG
jgi:hypothetical protein